MPNIGYLNGIFLPLEDVRISVEDRGFQFGDGVYEVVRVYGGSPFRLDAHLDRLAQSAEAIQLPVKLDFAEWREKVSEAIRLSQYSESKVYIQITRGVAPREHNFPSSFTPTVLMTVRQIDGLDTETLTKGVSAITVPDLRWGRCSVKSINLLPNVLAKEQAKAAGAFEAIFIRDGVVVEGTSSNVMLVNQGKLFTPPLSDHILAGVTREIVLDLAKSEGIPCEERIIAIEEVQSVDELLLVGTTIEVLSVIRLNGSFIGTGNPGPVSQRLARKFKALVS